MTEQLFEHVRRDVRNMFDGGRRKPIYFADRASTSPERLLALGNERTSGGNSGGRRH
jgi:hypothetical protein